MAEPLVTEAPKTADDILTGTSEEFEKRMQTEADFYKTFERKYAEGKVKIVNPTDAPAPVVTPEAVETPKVEEKPVESAPVPVDEEIQVKIKKSDLGKYGNINEVFKSNKEKEGFIEHLKGQLTEFNTKIAEAGQSKVEIDRLKSEKAELEKKLSSVVTVPPTASTVAQASVLADIKLPTFDDLDKLTPEQLQEKLYEADNLKKVIESVRQTSKIVDYAKTLESKIGKLEEAIKTTSDAQAKMSADYTKVNQETQERQRIDGIFNNIGELQSKFDDLKTKVPVRDLDLQYQKFVQDLGMIEKKYDAPSIDAIVTKFFNDPSAEGETLRKKAETLGVRPPEDVDKYLAIRKALDVSTENKLPLDEAYALHQYKSGGIKKMLSMANSEESKRRQEAVEVRQTFAKTADSTQAGAQPVTLEAEEKLFRDLMAQNIPFGEIKKDPAKKALYDKFAIMNGMPIPWEKF